MSRDREAERVVRARSREEVVVEYIDGVYEPPQSIAALVEQYRKDTQVVNNSVSYPRSIDERMNALFDAMLVMV